MNASKIHFHLARGLLTLCFLIQLTSCGKPPAPTPSEYLPTTKFKIITTSVQLAELVTQVGGDAVTVECVAVAKPQPPQHEPTEWAPNPFKINLRAADLFAMQTAHMVVMNGLGTEGKLEAEAPKLRTQGVAVVIIGEAIPASERLTLPDGSADPCYWNSPLMWKYAVTAVTKGLQQLVRPEAADYFEYRAQPVIDRLNRLITWSNEKLNASKPRGQRFLLSTHNTLGYFARDFGMETRALWNAADGALLIKDDSELMAWLEKNKVSDLLRDYSCPRDEVLDDFSVKFGIFATKPVYTIYPARPGTNQLGKMESLDVGTYDGAMRQLIRVIENRLGGSRTKSATDQAPEAAAESKAPARLDPTPDPVK
jgi:ABC-type Zn uptake system ZnuABC Zn-binding protein ZnuA